MEPTEEIFPSLLEIQKKKYHEFVTGADSYVPEVILDRPNRRLLGIEELKDEILQLNTEIVEKKDLILDKIRENLFNIETDEGFLETAMEEYEKCYHIDATKCNALVEDEVERLRNELRKAKEDSDALVQKMQDFLRQNHHIVQDFLKMSHMAVYNLSMPTHLRTMGVDDFNIDPTKMEESKKAAALESQSNEDDMDDVDDSMAWKPFLEH